MILFSRFCLGNGLKLLVHEDHSTPLAAVNLLYDTGSKDEDPDATGMAHLFEHLMFSGTPAIPDFDSHLQVAGGESNAFTNSDITNYYITIPAANIETAFWLESDRMSQIDFSEKNLEVQKKVVTEEFRQRYINQPYGMAMHRLLNLAYKKHPYRWPAIGKTLSHIAKTGISDIRDFFNNHYGPNNAILVVAGNVNTRKIVDLTHKWFSDIPPKLIRPRNLPVEPQQKKHRQEIISENLPSNTIYMAWHSCSRTSTDFNALDMITDILAGGESGRLYNVLVKDKRYFSDINIYLTPDIDPGLVIMHGKLMDGVSIEKGEKSVSEVISTLTERYVQERELEKIRNKSESSVHLANTSILNKASNLAFYELLGDPDLINKEARRFMEIDRVSLRDAAGRYLRKENCSTLHYLSKNDR